MKNVGIGQKDDQTTTLNWQLFRTKHSEFIPRWKRMEPFVSLYGITWCNDWKPSKKEFDHVGGSTS